MVSPTNSRKRFRILTPATAFAGFMLALWCMASLFFGANPFDVYPFDDMRFNKVAWQEDATCSDGSNRRGRMCDDLLKHQLYFGESETEVVGLLGDNKALENGPSALNTLLRQGAKYLIVAQPDWNEKAVTVLKYHVGEEFNLLMGIDVAFVYLAFDSRNRYIGGAVGCP